MTPSAPFGREEIEKIIPHRDPFLLVDEVLELEPGKRVVARRHVRPDDWWFPGHFPQRPVMPGVLTVEAIAQAGAVAVLADPANAGKLPFFAGIDGCKFKRIVEPGDELTLECEFVRVRGPVAKGEGRRRPGARGALRAACPEGRATYAPPAPRSRGRTRRVAGGARQALRAAEAVPRRVAVLDVAAPARREHVPRRRRAPARSRS